MGLLASRIRRGAPVPKQTICFGTCWMDGPRGSIWASDTRDVLLLHVRVCVCMFIDPWVGHISVDMYCQSRDEPDNGGSSSTNVS